MRYRSLGCSRRCDDFPSLGGKGTRDGSVLIKGVYNTSMDRYDEQLCRTCGSSSESLRYKIPPHSVKTSAKFCPDCGVIMPNAPVMYQHVPKCSRNKKTP